jgi:glutaredoxin
MMQRIWNWFRWAKATSHHPVGVILYTRAGCHLCDDALRILTENQRSHAFALDIVDVDTDPILAIRYGARVPVVVINEKERFHGNVNPVLLARLLRHEAS